MPAVANGRLIPEKLLTLFKTANLPVLTHSKVSRGCVEDSRDSRVSLYPINKYTDESSPERRWTAAPAQR